ncbi:MAG: hypothetical protein HY958_04450 [Bacteroidia bacterium]|nr:hypothetical protein [Bacteroidia bacterium]
MKRKHIYGLVLCFITFVSFSFNASAQRCDKKDLCNDEDYGDYDFKSQTHFAKLSPGDTSTINIVAYSGNDMRILVCADEELGEIKYQIVEPIREVKKVMKVGPERIEEVFKMDPNTGERAVDEFGQTTKLGDKKVRDTTYETKTNIIEKLIYDNSKSKDKPFYEEKNIPKTKRLRIKVQVPKGQDPELVACVNVLVGRKSAKSNKFLKGKD